LKEERLEKLAGRHHFFRRENGIYYLLDALTKKTRQGDVQCRDLGQWFVRWPSLAEHTLTVLSQGLNRCLKVAYALFERFNLASLPLQNCNLHALFLHLTVFFQEFVEEHCVDRLVAYCIRLVPAIVRDEVRCDLVHVLRDKAKLRSSFGVDFGPVSEAYRPERENSLALAAYRMDVRLVLPR
jgi:hypothetical protein